MLKTSKNGKANVGTGLETGQDRSVLNSENYVSTGQTHRNRVEMPPVKVELEVDERGLYEYAVALYSNELAFVREALQNSLDDGANEFSITAGPRQIELSDNGNGMSKAFLEGEFNKIGKGFKHGDARGEYGVGRLSVWLPLAEVGDGEVKYFGDVRIITADGKRKTMLEWDKISHYKLTDLGETEEHGTTITINSDRELPREFSAAGIQHYVSETVLESPAEIKLNNAPLKNAYNSIFSVSGEGHFKNQFVSPGSPKYKYTMGLDPESRTIGIFEKGLKVAEVSAAVGGSINFLDGRYRGQHIGIKPLSREGTLLDENDLRIAFLLKAAMPYYSSLPLEEREKEAERMVDMGAGVINSMEAKGGGRISMLFEGGKAGELRRFIEQIVVDGRTLKDWKSTKAVWTDGQYSESELDIAKQKGYNILETHSRYWKMIFKALKIPSIDTIKRELVNDITLRDPENDKEMSLLKASATYAKMIQPIIRDLNGGFKNTVKTIALGMVKGIMGISVVAISIATGLRQLLSNGIAGIPSLVRIKFDDIVESVKYLKYIDAQNKDKKSLLKTLGKGLKAGKVRLYMVADDNVNVIAETIGRRKIAINVNNELVRKVLDNGRADLLMPTIVHEFVHVMGYGDHDDDFNRVYNTLLIRMQCDIAGLQHLMPSCMKASGDSVVIDPVTIGKQEAARMGLNTLPPGSEIPVLVRARESKIPALVRARRDPAGWDGSVVGSKHR